MSHVADRFCLFGDLGAPASLGLHVDVEFLCLV